MACLTESLLTMVHLRREHHPGKLEKVRLVSHLWTRNKLMLRDSSLMCSLLKLRKLSLPSLRLNLEVMELLVRLLLKCLLQDRVVVHKLLFHLLISSQVRSMARCHSLNLMANTKLKARLLLTITKELKSWHLTASYSLRKQPK